MHWAAVMTHKSSLLCLPGKWIPQGDQAWRTKLLEVMSHCTTQEGCCFRKKPYVYKNAISVSQCLGHSGILKRETENILRSFSKLGKQIATEVSLKVTNRKTVCHYTGISA